MRTYPYAVIALLAAIPSARAQEQPATDDRYPPMPVPPSAPTDPGPPSAEPPPAAEPEASRDDVGYFDAGAEAEVQAQAEYDSSYVDDGYDPEAWLDYESTLSRYGSWVNTADYGPVWSPSGDYVGADFMPYASGGHWVLSEYGWTWVSDWDWGWAPFHYGRWFVVGNYGWCWRPGRLWGPAWVSWRYGGGYVGWTPLPPRGIRVSPPPQGGRHGGWRFTTVAGLAAPRPTFVAAARAGAAFGATAPIRNVQSINAYRVEAGPHPQTLAAALGRPLQPVSVHALPAAAPRSTIVPRTPPGASLSRPGAMAPGAAFARVPPAAGAGGGAPWRAATPSYASPSYRPAPSFGAPAYRGAPAASPPAGNPAVTDGQPAYRPGAWQDAPAYQPAPGHGAPAYRPAPSDSAPAYRPAPSDSAPAYRPAPSASAPAYRPAPSYGSPVYRPAPAPSYSAPVYRPAPSYSAPVYRPGPSSGAPVYRPAPSPAYSAPPGAAPSYSPPSYQPSPAARPAPAPGAPARPSYSAPAARPPAQFGGRR